MLYIDSNQIFSVNVRSNAKNMLGARSNVKSNAKSMLGARSNARSNVRSKEQC